MISKTLLLFALIAATTGFVAAQSPAPAIVVQAAPPAATTVPAVAAPGDGALSALRALEQVKAANDEVLKKQAAALQQLEEMEKAAEQIKIYTKRG
jgi:hypothetical protein